MIHLALPDFLRLQDIGPMLGGDGKVEYHRVRGTSAL